MEGLNKIEIMGRIPTMPDASGGYIAKDRVIGITAVALNDESSAQHVVLHEIGHHVLNTNLERRTQNNWNAFWMTHKNDMPTGYAKTRMEEGFAESYQQYRKNPDSLSSPVRGWFEKYVY